MSTQITTGKVRFSYCNLFTPRAVQEGATPKYSVTLLIPKSDKATMQKIKAAMDEAAYQPQEHAARRRRRAPERRRVRRRVQGLLRYHRQLQQQARSRPRRQDPAD